MHRLSTELGSCLHSAWGCRVRGEGRSSLLVEHGWIAHGAGEEGTKTSSNNDNF